MSPAQLKHDLIEFKKILVIMLEIIKEAGPRGIPSGHFYANLIGHMSFEMYRTMIDILVASERVKMVNHVLTYNTEFKEKEEAL